MSDRADMTLWASDVMLDDLLVRARDWSTRPEAEQLDFFLEWEELMDRLNGVVADWSNGRASEAQSARLTDLARRLKDARPVIERLGLDYPDLGRLSLAS
ncbi:MAG: hypothetical protein U0893_14770 [Chloroflexota bacterium]